MYATKSTKDQFTETSRITSKNLRERKKKYFEVTLSNSKTYFKQKPKSIVKQGKTLEKPNIWFWVHCLAKHAPKSAKDQFTKLCRLISGAIREGAKINFKIPYLTWRQVLTNNQRALLKREKLQKCLQFDSGCTVCQSTPQNMLYINLLNFVGLLHEPLEK